MGPTAPWAGLRVTGSRIRGAGDGGRQAQQYFLTEPKISKSLEGRPGHNILDVSVELKL